MELISCVLQVLADFGGGARLPIISTPGLISTRMLAGMFSAGTIALVTWAFSLIKIMSCTVAYFLTISAS